MMIYDLIKNLFHSYNHLSFAVIFIIYIFMKITETKINAYDKILSSWPTRAFEGL